MKKIIYIGFFAMLLLFSCSKEQPLQPVNTMDDTFIPLEIKIKGSEGKGKSTGEDGKSSSTGSSGSGDITDPDKDDGKGRSNKKAKV